MGRRVINIYTCDRKTCEQEFEIKRPWPADDIHTVGGLKYIFLRDGSGSGKYSEDGEILCPDCTAEFYRFMTGENIEDY